MKKIKRLLLFAAVCLTATSCFDSNDEVNYKTANKITLTDSRTEELILLDRFATLTLTPVISQSLAKDENNLEFNWRIRENTQPRDPYPYYDLGDSRNLEIVINAAVGIHKIVYSVTDKQTGVSEFLAYDIRVIGEYTEGWAILEETAQGGDLSMILPTGRVARNIYSHENGAYLEIPCVGLAIPNFGEYLHKMLIFTATQGIETSLEEFTRLSGMTDWFEPGTEPAPSEIKPQLYDAFIYGWRGLINDGQYHVQVMGGFPGDPSFGGALPAPVDDNGFRRDYYLAPFIVRGGANSATASPVQIIYDALQGRFMYGYMDGLTLALKHYPQDDDNAWDPSNVGMTMRHMDESNIEYVHNAIMEDDAGDLWLLRCDGTAVVTTSNIPASSRHNRFANSKIQLSAELNDFSIAMSSKRLDHMYFVIDNKIYRYDVPGDILYEEYTFGVNEKPVVIRSKSTGGSETLYVATNEGNQGRVYYFVIEPTGSLPETHSELFEGFGKIVDLKYKD